MFPQSTGRKFLLIIVAAFLIAGAAVAAVQLTLKSEMDTDLGSMPVPGTTPVEINAHALESVKAEVIAKVGQPIEGFEPSMLMTTYAGLIEADFNGVQANGGIYRLMAGVLQLSPRAGAAVSSADGALTDLGMMQMLVKAAARLDLAYETNADIDILLAALRSVKADGNGDDQQGPGQPVIPPAGAMTVTGNYVCLPHRDTSGPQTMECAFGIHVTETNKYYALDFNEVKDDEWMNLSMQSKLTVRGTFVPAAALSSNMWQIYPIEGIIRVTSIAR